MTKSRLHQNSNESFPDVYKHYVTSCRKLRLNETSLMDTRYCWAARSSGNFRKMNLIGWIKLKNKMYDVPNLSFFFKYICFWSQIRAGLYDVITAFCQKHPTLILDHKSSICPAVLHSLDESAPRVTSSLWECVLHLTSTVSDWWTVVNPQKGMLPQLWKVLRTAGSGSARVIFPNLLPFLSTMPASETRQNKEFLQKFFTSFNQGYAYPLYNLMYFPVKSWKFESVLGLSNVD